MIGEITEFLKSLAPFAWLAFWFWLMARIFRLYGHDLKNLLQGVSSVKTPIGTIEFSAKRVELSGLIKSIRKELKSGDPQKVSQLLDKELPRMEEAVSQISTAAPGKQISSPISMVQTTVLAKMRDLAKDRSDDWIDDDIFVSGTYGYNFWRSEIELMLRKGWIEVADNRVRLTPAGLHAVDVK